MNFNFISIENIIRNIFNLEFYLVITIFYFYRILTYIYFLLITNIFKFLNNK